MVGQIVSGEVYQVWKKELLLLDDEGNEMLLPKTEQIPSDFFRKGETVRAVVGKVDIKNNNPKIKNSIFLYLDRNDSKKNIATKIEIAPTIILGISSFNSFS